jgi:hypothetical protein
MASISVLSSCSTATTSKVRRRGRQMIAPQSPCDRRSSLRPSQTWGLAISPGGQPGGQQGKRDDQGRDDLPEWCSPRFETVPPLKSGVSYALAGPERVGGNGAGWCARPSAGPQPGASDSSPHAGHTARTKRPGSALHPTPTASREGRPFFCVVCRQPAIIELRRRQIMPAVVPPTGSETSD